MYLVSVNHVDLEHQFASFDFETQSTAIDE